MYLSFRKCSIELDPSEDDKIKEGGGGGGVSTDFKGNVGVTVIVPGGEFRRGVSVSIICS